jgi:hypothetical protein
MKNLKEKQLLVNLAKTLGQKADEEIVKELREFDRIKTEARKSVSKDPMSYILEAARKLNEEPKMDTPEYPLPPSLDELQEMLKDIPELKPEDRIEVLEGEEEWASKAIDESEETLIEKSVKFISEAPKESFQQPDPPKTSADIQAIVNKLKYLEQWMGKVAAAGAGSGETKFKYLDDLEKSSIGDTDQILRYRPSPIGDRYGTFFFGQLSGNQGPIQSMLYTPTQDLYSGNVTRQAGLTYYDSREDTLEIIHDDGAATYTGQDNYIRVYNNYGANLIKGTFVQFSGTLDDLVTCAPFVNDANAQGLYSIGVLATNTEANTMGRAKLLGEIRDVDTSGISVGETWQMGDLLWANPNIPGTLSKYKPTAPNIAVSVAAVLRANSDSGIMLVRPIIWPRLLYADFYRQTTLTASSPNTDTIIPLTNTLITSGFSRNGNSIIARNSGLYKFDVRAQLKSGSSNEKNIALWYKKNGINIPYSAVRQSVAINGGFSAITNTQLISLVPGDNVTIHFAVTDTTLIIDSPAPIDGSPNVPAVQMTIVEAAL